ncbi:MAG TPA: response regulator [Candidatus Saccharimonadales bacterium]|nr:response regulator [Candidatus Saccharimonadales bacterium]
MRTGSKITAHLLIVDDSDDDVFILTRALRKNGVTHPIDSAYNGSQGIKYLEALLRQEPGQADFPSLVLLDLKMPMVDGHEVLAWIRTQPGLSRLPVYVLSSSELQSDISRARELGAADYWTKPTAFPEYRELAAKIKDLLPPAPSDTVAMSV